MTSFAPLLTSAEVYVYTMLLSGLWLFILLIVESLLKSMQFQPNPSLGTQWSLLQLCAVLKLMIAFGVKDKYASSLNIHIKVIALFHWINVNNMYKVLISTELLVRQESK